MRRRSTPLTAPAATNPAGAAVDSLQRGLDILRCFQAGEHLLSAAEIARRLGLPRATTLRLLETLADHDFLLRADEGYGLHVGCFALGQAVLTGSALVRAARAPLQALADQHSVHALLAVGDRDDLLVLAHFAGVAAASWSLGAGTHLPVSGTAPGLAWLWAQAPDVQARWVAQLRAGADPAGLAGLWRAFHQLETTGICAADWAGQAGMEILAAPLVLPDGSTAVIACAKTRSGQSERQATALTSAMREALQMTRDALPRTTPGR